MKKIRIALAMLAACALAQPAFPATVTVPGALNRVSLSPSIITTGGTAVTPLAPGQRTAGGFIYNPAEATVNLCVNENGPASGTVSQGDLICVPPGTTYQITPGPGPVSVVSSDSAHKFSGYGLKQ